MDSLLNSQIALHMIVNTKTIYMRVNTKNRLHTIFNKNDAIPGIYYLRITQPITNILALRDPEIESVDTSKDDIGKLT